VCKRTHIAAVLAAIAMSLSRDDLRTRSGAAGSARGSTGAEQPRAQVRTVQMITFSKRAANSRVCGETGAGTVSHGVAGPFSDDDSERTAVIARCGMERSAACRSGGQGNNAR
jgi:hypothetical protein